MWQKLRNLWLSLRSYGDMSPDLGLRRQINQSLRSRSARTLEQQYLQDWQPLSVSRDIFTFTFQQLEDYSGLQFSRVLPSDRLTEDLRLSLVCWFDWECTLCDDFRDRFGVEIHDTFDPYSLNTVQALVLFLHQQAVPVNYS